ncbi:hypothetical protein ACQ858_07270 [Variovorax ureilyticus]|uniref:hypothetical protein n=1 Tax=Variovorax ureilyticus TaxID=1836198 RepID=UPI003D674D42
MPFRESMICVPRPAGPQIGSAGGWAAAGVVDGAVVPLGVELEATGKVVVLPPPPQALSNVAPADALAKAMNARRPGDCMPCGADAGTIDSDIPMRGLFMSLLVFVLMRRCKSSVVRQPEGIIYTPFDAVNGNQDA